MPEPSKSLLISSDEFEPAYMKLFRTSELYRRSRQALRHLDTARCVRKIVKSIALKISIRVSGEIFRVRQAMLRILPFLEIVSEKKYGEINRRPTSSEIVTAKTTACQKGLHRFDQRAPA